MKLKRNWEIKAGLWDKLKNLYKKGGFNPAYYVYRYRFNSYPSSFKIGEYPIDVIAETANVCNLRCGMCFQVDKALPVNKTTKTPFMSMETFKRIVDECAQSGIPALKLNWRGEPMLNKNFLPMLQYAKSRGILEVTSLTNGTLMDKEMVKGIVKARMDQIVISIDGFTKETYEKIRVGADFDLVMSNLNNLLKVRGRSRKPFIRLQYTESGINRHETQAFFDYWKSRVDEVTVSYCQDFGSPEKDDPEQAPIHEFCCAQPFQRLVVMTDGTVTACATDVMGYNSIGNINDQTLKEIWHSAKIRELRDLHRTGAYHRNPMCKICVHNVFKANKAAGRLNK